MLAIPGDWEDMGELRDTTYAEKSPPGMAVWSDTLLGTVAGWKRPTMSHSSKKEFVRHVDH